MCTKLDYPRLRNFGLCPLCGHPKAKSALACWLCTNARGIGAGDEDPYAERQFAAKELELARAERALRKVFSRMEGVASNVCPIIRRAAS